MSSLRHQLPIYGQGMVVGRVKTIFETIESNSESSKNILSMPII